MIWYPEICQPKSILLTVGPRPPQLRLNAEDVVNTTTCKPPALIPVKRRSDIVRGAGPRRCGRSGAFVCGRDSQAHGIPWRKNDVVLGASNVTLEIAWRVCAMGLRGDVQHQLALGHFSNTK